MIPYSDINGNDYQTKSEAKKEFIIISEDLNLKEDITTHDTDILNLQNQINLKENITDHDTDMTNINTALNTKESKTDHNTDINNINTALNILTNEMSTKESKTDHDTDINNINTALNNKVSSSTYAQGMTNVNNELALKESITAHNADITQLSNSIANLQTKIEKEYVGNYYVDQTNKKIYFANGLIFDYHYMQNEQHPETYIAVNLYRPLGSYATIKDLILPGSLYTDPNLDFHYWWSGNSIYSNLTTLTICGDLFNIHLNLDYMPKLQHFNLMEGLQEITISSTNTRVIENLKFPASLKACYLTNINFYNLIFEGTYKRDNRIELKLVMTNCTVYDNLVCERKLTSESSIQSNQTITHKVLPTLRVSGSFLKYLKDDNIFGHVDNKSCANVTSLFFTGEAELPDINLTFRVIYNLCNYDHTYSSQNLVAGTWVG